MRSKFILLFAVIFSAVAVPACGAAKGNFAPKYRGDVPPAHVSANHSRYVYPGGDGRLVYPEIDRWGNRFPDYSYAGYAGGGVKLPLAEVKVTVSPDGDDEDDTRRIQAAVDKLAGMPLGEDGFRGALLMEAGVYEVRGPIYIRASGVVLRGGGQNVKTGTVIKCTKQGPRRSMGWSRDGWKHSLFQVGMSGRGRTDAETARKITDKYLPLGSKTFTVENADGYELGDRIRVEVLENALFRKNIVGYPLWTDDKETGGKKIFILRNNHRGLEVVRHSHDRTIVKIDGDRITVDVPLYNPIAEAYGGGRIKKYANPDEIDHVGFENMRMVSYWEPVRKEDSKKMVDPLTHAECAVVVYNTRDFFFRDVTTEDFLGHHFSLMWGARRGTVVDCSALNPDPKFYESYGYVARYGFSIAAQTLVYRCYATNCRHSFNSGAGAGPRVLLDCLSEGNQGGPGPHMGFINGDLYDNVRNYDTELQISTRGQRAWRGINCAMWNCGAAAIVCMMPPESHPPVGYNWAIGCYRLPGTDPDRPAGHRRFYRQKGELLLRDEKDPQIGDGVWESFGRLVEPRSLYEKQLEDRLGHQAVINTRYRIDWKEASKGQ